MTFLEKIRAAKAQAPVVPEAPKGTRFAAPNTQSLPKESGSTTELRLTAQHECGVTKFRLTCTRWFCSAEGHYDVNPPALEYTPLRGWSVLVLDELMQALQAAGCRHT